MPDQYGRVGPSDIRGLQSQYIQASTFKQSQEDAAEERFTSQKTDEYLDQLSSGADIDSIRGSDSEFSPKAAIAAQASWTAIQTNELRRTKAQQEVDLGEDMASFRDATELSQRGLGLLDSGKTKEGLTVLLDLFNKKIVDGNIAELIEQDGFHRVQITGPDGNIIEGAEAMSEADVREFVTTIMQPSGKGGRENWVKVQQKARQSRQQQDLEAAHAPKTYRATADGSDVLIYTKRNPETGEEYNTYFHVDDHRELTEEEAEAMHLRPIGFWRERATQKALAVGKAAKGLGKPEKPLSPFGKETEDLMEIFGLDKDTAGKLSLKMKQNVKLNEMVMKLYADGWEPDESEIQAIKGTGEDTVKMVEKAQAGTSKAELEIDPKAIQQEYYKLKKEMGGAKARAEIKKKYPNLRF